MKKLTSIIAGLFLLALSLNANAQAPASGEYFVGKWNVVVTNTPQGDGKLTVTLERKDSKLGGSIITKPGADSVKITKVDESEKSIIVYFTTDGYDVNLTLEKKDNDNVTGNVMGMFDAKGVRVKETAPKP